MTFYLGCAGWSLPRATWPRFPADGTHLQRYAAQFTAVEINSAFYRPHRFSTYQRWAGSVPDSFRFAVKVPKHITHERRLQGSAAALDEFLAQCSGLGEKLGCLLVQLPPSLAFEPGVAQAFLEQLRARFQGSVALEPRHESWLGAQPLLVQHHIARVAADPSPLPGGTQPGGWPGLRYYRLHGSPRIYHSAYGEPYLQALARTLGANAWCMFDNTASGMATTDALALKALMEDR